MSGGWIGVPSSLMQKRRRVSPMSIRLPFSSGVGPVMRRPEVAHPVLDVRGWPRTAATREELGAAIEAAGVPDSSYFLQSAVREDAGGRSSGDGTRQRHVRRKPSGTTKRAKAARTEAR